MTAESSRWAAPALFDVRALEAGGATHTPPAADSFTPDQLCRLLDIPFTDEQLAAITAPPVPSVVVAGAGSGKTAVMSARVVWLVATGHVRPERVLGLTFTNKAAAELSGRVRRALARLGDVVPLDHDDLTPTVSTYHAYAARLLREHGARLGLEPAASLLADAERYQVAERVVRRAAGPFTALRGSVSDCAGQVVALDAELGEHLVAPDAVVAFDDRVVAAIDAVERTAGKLTQGVRTARDKARARSELLQLVAAYRAEKHRRERVDFGDQMAGAALLAEQVPEVGAGERERFTAVLLDEYQDTSITQKRLLLGLFGGGHAVTAVGDPFQAIYGWRGASVRNIDRFADEFTHDGRPATRFTLARNNRSGQRILDLANQVAEPLRSRHAGVPVLVPRPDAVGRGEVEVGLYPTRADEVAAVVADVVGQVGAGTRYRDIAVLARASSTFAAYADALTEAGVPVEVVGLGGLLAMPEVVDLVSVLEVLDTATANPALVRLLTGPRWRIGPRDLALLGRRAQQLVRLGEVPAAGEAPGPAAGDRLDAALLDAVAGSDPAEVSSLADALDDPGPLPYSAAARERFALLADELRRLRGHRSQPLLDVVHRVLTETGLDVEVSASPQALHARRKDTLAAFLDHVAAFDGVDGDATLSSFLAYLRAAEAYEGGLDATAPTEADSVKLLTVHKAKGLEWEVVYLPDLAPSVFPSGKGRQQWTRRAELLPFELRGDADDLPVVTGWQGEKGLKEFAAELRELDDAEERRLGYVAFTRAKRRLVATSHWWGPTQKRKRGAGAFLTVAHAYCEAGFGTIAHWEPEPADDTNPSLQHVHRPAWPAEPDPAAARERLAGAELVRAARADGAGPLPAALLEGDWSRVVAGWDADLDVLIAEASERFDVDRDVPLPASLSASQLVRLSADPAGLARDLARPLPRPPARAASRGTRFHAWVEARFGQGALLDLDDLAGAGDPQPPDADLERLQAGFLAGPYADVPPLAVEAPFQLVLGGHTVRGRIDAVYSRDDGGFDVVDWKTGRTAADPLQLAVYRLAWAELSGVALAQVDGVFYYVADGRVDRPHDLPDRAALEALLTA